MQYFFCNALYYLKSFIVTAIEIAINVTHETLHFSVYGALASTTPPQKTSFLGDVNKTVVYNFTSIVDPASNSTFFGVTATVVTGSSLTLYANGYLEVCMWISNGSGISQYVAHENLDKYIMEDRV